MPANASRRPQLLAGQARANLQSTQAAHRERLQNVGRAGDAGRPPILPPLSKAGGYPRDEVEHTPAEASGPPRPLGPKSPRGARAVSLEAAAGGPRTTQSAASPSSSRSSGRGASKGSKALVPTSPPSQDPDDEEEEEDDGEEDEDVEDDEFLEDLAELDRLAQHLNRGHAAAGGADAENGRPASGTSISASTTVPCGSSISEATFGTEDVDEARTATPQAPREEISENPLEFLQGAQRVHHELQSCTLPPGCRVECTPGSRAQFFFTMDVAEGPYTPATLTFWVKIFEDFPAPGGYSIRCTKNIFHPNVSADDRGVCLPSQQDAGGSSSSTALALCGPRHYPFRDLLLELRRCICSPGDSPAVNADAAMLLQTDPDEFRRVVRTTLSGGDYRGVRFDQVMNLSRLSTKPLELQDEEPKRTAMPEKMRLGMMKLEVMRDDFKAQASAWQHANTLECKKLAT
mmetsp:Transcript_3600/g.9061  ORF Transcript_3600/g.9061 Transcript_3600/m.9061 type:complete len:461 (-) Transcript_3600:51-1433(-)